MKALLSVVVIFLMGSSAFAYNDFGVVLGYRSNSADAVNSTDSVSSEGSWAAGVEGFFDVAPQFAIRTGFLYETRKYSFTPSGGTSGDMTLSYIDIPITAEYKFADYAGVFAGPVLGLLASKDKSGSWTSNPSSSTLGLQLGVTFKFAPQLGGEVFYEMIPSKFAPDYLENAKTVGVNLLVTFE
jgi:hypothetical protein